MKGLRIIRLMNVFSRKHPVRVVLIGLAVVVGAISILEQFWWGQWFNRFLGTLFSSEAGAISWYAQGYGLWQVVGLICLANIVNLLGDVWLVRIFLRMPRIRRFLEILSRTAKSAWSKIKKAWSNRNSAQVTRQSVANHDISPLARLNGIANDPSKGGLGSIFIFSAIPRIPFIPIGGTAVAVLIIKYNKFGLRGWLALAAGIFCRITYTVLFCELTLT